jgi:hypothetical protein
MSLPEPKSETTGRPRQLCRLSRQTESLASSMLVAGVREVVYDKCCPHSEQKGVPEEMSVLQRGQFFVGEVDRGRSRVTVVAPPS